MGRVVKLKRFIRPETLEKAVEDVVGQQELRRKMVAVISQYTLYLDNPAAGRPIACVYGPSGSGKTFVIEKLVRAAGLPFTLANSASISPPGIKGLTLRDVLIQHWFDHQTDEGIIFLDEVDKWCRGAIGAGTEEVSAGLRCQSEILKYVQSDRLTFLDESKDLEGLENVVFDTTKILWIFAGAFTGLERMVKLHLHGQFPDEEVWEHAQAPDFERYGMMRELTNRVETWAWVKPLSQLEILEILRLQQRPKWEIRFRAIGCKLDLTDGALGRCAVEAHRLNTGARGAVALLQRAMDDIFAEASRHRAKSVRVESGDIETGRVSLVS